MQFNHRFGVAVAMIVTASVGVVSAQIAISDPPLIARDAAIAVLKGQILDALTNEAQQIQQMSERLGALTDLNKYAISDGGTPTWRIHSVEGDRFLYANSYNAALNYGDRAGSAFDQVARSRVDAGQALATLGEEELLADAAIRSELATLDAADSSIIVGTNQTGQLRYNGGNELSAIVALERDTIDSSSDKSTTAVLDKISGAGLIRARQQQARIQFMAAITEQLLVDNKRTRDTDAAAMNMQLERLRWGAAASASLARGSADALRSWRQP